MNIALVAHDNKKESMVNFCIAYKEILQKHHLIATKITGRSIEEVTNLRVEKLKSGTLGGDYQIGAEIVNDNIDLVIFFRDPWGVQSHEPDILSLLKLCDIYKIPVATNIATAEILVRAMERGEFHWREIVKNN